MREAAKIEAKQKALATWHGVAHAIKPQEKEQQTERRPRKCE